MFNVTAEAAIRLVARCEMSWVRCSCRDAALLGLVKLAQALGPLLVVPAAQLVHDISKYVLSPAVFPALAAQVESDEEDADAATDEEFADLPGCRLAAHEDSEGGN